MPDHYFTIEKQSEGLYKEKGSKFIAKAFPVNDEEEIKNILDDLRKEFHDARHHCYAWVLGPSGDRVRANDDGEPSSSAGKPILAQINSGNLTNILVVVIRYFGGTLLGVGGLINAYRSASHYALDNAKIIKQYLYSIFEVKFGYPEMNNVMRIIKEMNAVQLEQQFELSCSLKVKIKKDEKEIFISSFSRYPEIELKLIRED